MQRRKSAYEKRDIVRVVSTGEVGMVGDVLPGGRYRVEMIPPTRTAEDGGELAYDDLGEIGVFSAEELELEL
jgi:hypothetical protein